jgi:hypothetical protein
MIKAGDICPNCRTSAILHTPTVNGFDLVCANERCRYQASPVRADNGQVGGDHYKRLGTTPWDLTKCIESTGIAFVDYVRGDIIAYVARLKDMDKGRPAMLEKMREELLKTAHYAKEAAQVITEHLAHFEKDEEQARQGQGHLFKDELGLTWGPSPNPFRFDFTETQLDLPLVMGDF